MTEYIGITKKKKKASLHNRDSTQGDRKDHKNLLILLG